MNHHPEPRTLSLKPCTLHPKPKNLNLESGEKAPGMPKRMHRLPLTVRVSSEQQEHGQYRQRQPQPYHLHTKFRTLDPTYYRRLPLPVAILIRSAAATTPYPLNTEPRTLDSNEAPHSLLARPRTLNPEPRTIDHLLTYSSKQACCTRTARARRHSG